MSLLSAIPVIGQVIDRVFGVIDQAVVDKDLAVQLKADLQTQLLQIDHSEFEKEIEDRANARALSMKEAETDVYLAKLLRGTVRPMTAYAFVGIYITIKVSMLVLLWRMATTMQQLIEGAKQVWGIEDFAIMGGILGFYFGLRSAVDKRRAAP